MRRGALGALALLVSACAIGESDDGIVVLDGWSAPEEVAEDTRPGLEALDGPTAADPSTELDDPDPEGRAAAGTDDDHPVDGPDDDTGSEPDEGPAPYGFAFPPPFTDDDGDEDQWPDPADLPDGSDRAGLDAALITWHDLPEGLVGARWALPSEDGEGMSSERTVHDLLVDCVGSEERDASRDHELSMDETEAARAAYQERLDAVSAYLPEPVLGQHRHFMGSDIGVDVVHTIDRVADASTAEWHLEQLDGLASACAPFVPPDPDDPEGLHMSGSGQTAPLEVPSLGDGATAWRVATPFQETWFYHDHIRWHQDDVLVTVTVMRLPLLPAMIVPDGEAVFLDGEAQAVADVAELVVALDQKLTAARSRD